MALSCTTVTLDCSLGWWIGSAIESIRCLRCNLFDSPQSCDSDSTRLNNNTFLEVTGQTNQVLFFHTWSGHQCILCWLLETHSHCAMVYNSFRPGESVYVYFYMPAMSCTRHHRDLACAFVWIRRTGLLLGGPQEIPKPFLFAFYRHSSPRTPLVRMLHDNLWPAVFFRQRTTHRNIQLSLSSAHRQQHTRLGGLPICSQPHNTAHFSYLLSLFRYFPAGHFRIHTLTHLN